jgi:hypothetical protein
MADESFRVLWYLVDPAIYLAETTAGWFYREPAPGEYARWKDIDAYPMQGPFADVEEAARHAAATLDLSRAWGQWETLAKATSGEMGRAIQVMYEVARGASEQR